jgi:hypothetical protein
VTKKNPVGKHCSTRICNAKFATCFQKASRLARPVTRLASLRPPITNGLRKAKKDARRIANLLRTPHAREAKRASCSLRKSRYQTTGAHTHGCYRTVGRRNFPRAASCNQPNQSRHSKSVTAPAFKMCSNKALRLPSNWRTCNRCRRSTRAQKHSKTESKTAKRRHRKRSSPQQNPQWRIGKKEWRFLLEV